MKKILLLLLILNFAASMKAQRIGIQTDAIHTLAGSPTIGIEFYPSDKYSVNMIAEGSPISLYRNFNFKIENKIWFSKVLTKSYLSFSPTIGFYDYNLKDRQKFSGIGLTIGYGYSFLLSERISMIPHVDCSGIYATSKDPKQKFYALPTIGLNIVYLIK
ncbi:MAG: DUF3575 domain-containing protein [Bacteroidales bacterium]